MSNLQSSLRRSHLSSSFQLDKKTNQVSNMMMGRLYQMSTKDKILNGSYEKLASAQV